MLKKHLLTVDFMSQKEEANAFIIVSAMVP